MISERCRYIQKAPGGVANECRANESCWMPGQEIHLPSVRLPKSVCVARIGNQTTRDSRQHKRLGTSPKAGPWPNAKLSDCRRRWRFERARRVQTSASYRTESRGGSSAPASGSIKSSLTEAPRHGGSESRCPLGAGRSGPAAPRLGPAPPRRRFRVNLGQALDALLARHQPPVCLSHLILGQLGVLASWRELQVLTHLGSEPRCVQGTRRSTPGPGAVAPT